ncbi:uncharacterized protein LOC110882363 [Helianthus annuus]|uniref:uncharacterized protein LOC110882363 n=1 Tax=Helianthus annuus TaxID=4232 RepID=UPI000B900ABA|nr:uncharacterized protein LOC110882363 [Helianthus annuus]
MVSISRMLQETKRESVSVGDVSGFWGKRNFGLDSVDAVGQSGGQVCLWDKSVFTQTGGTKNRIFLHIKGKLTGSGETLNVLNVYDPQGISAKKILWALLAQVITENDGLWVVAGDFNAVRCRDEKRNYAFKNSCANNFNLFIYNVGLIEYNMIGRKFTCSTHNRRKLSKLDRFLVFNSWFGKPGFEEVVEECLSGEQDAGGPSDVNLIRKLNQLRSKLKIWRDEMLKRSSEEVASAILEVDNIEAVQEERALTEEEEWILAESKKILLNEEERKNRDLEQRSRI